MALALKAHLQKSNSDGTYLATDPMPPDFSNLQELRMLVHVQDLHSIDIFVNSKYEIPWPGNDRLEIEIRIDVNRLQN